MILIYVQKYVYDFDVCTYNYVMSGGDVTNIVKYG